MRVEGGWKKEQVTKNQRDESEAAAGIYNV